MTYIIRHGYKRGSGDYYVSGRKWPWTTCRHCATRLFTYFEAETELGLVHLKGRVVKRVSKKDKTIRISEFASDEEAVSALGLSAPVKKALLDILKELKIAYIDRIEKGNALADALGKFKRDFTSIPAPTNKQAAKQWEKVSKCLEIYLGSVT